MNILLMGMPDIGIGYPIRMLTTPNLGLASIAANLDNNHTVRIADLVLRRKDVKAAVHEALDAASPQLVGLSAMTFQYKTAAKIAALIKKYDPRIQIALGGYHATLLFEEIADSSDSGLFDLLFRGEADLSFNEAVNALEKGTDLEEVAGLSFKKNGRFIHSRPRELEDLSQIKLPARNARLWNDFNVLKVPWDLIEFSRGCLMSCNFCNIRNMYGRSFRTHKLDRVMRDIAQAKNEGTKILLFVDDNITMDVRLFENLCDAIVANGHNDLIYGVQASARGIASSETLAEKMAEAGFKYVYLGIESPSKKNLAEWNKGDIVEQSKTSVRYLKKHGISVAGGFIVGNPDDDIENVEETFRFAKNLKTEFSAVQILVPYPKTKIREKLMQEGLVVRPYDYEMYDGGHPVVRTHFLDENELLQARYRFGDKYLGVRAGDVIKTLLKYRKKSLPFLAGSLKLLPEALGSLVFGGIKKRLISENKRFGRYWQGMMNLNKFDID